MKGISKVIPDAAFINMYKILSNERYMLHIRNRRIIRSYNIQTWDNGRCLILEFMEVFFRKKDLKLQARRRLMIVHKYMWRINFSLILRFRWVGEFIGS